MNIYLIGMRAVGKSSVGRSLAGAMNRPFMDLDLELTAEFGQSINDFVRLNGWKPFRRREEDMVARASALKNHIIATGGGVVCNDRNVSLMRDSGWVVWLKAGLDTLKQRLLTDSSTSELRPAIGIAEDPAAELESLLHDRMDAYQRAMHFSINTEKLGIKTICDQIIDAYKHR